MAELYEYQFTVLEKHLDTFGHVNNATYLALYEEARWDFITKNGFGLERIQREQIGPVILNINLEFKREIRNREIIRIESQFREMKNRMVMTIDQKMINSEGLVASMVELSVGVMDMKERKLLEPEKDWMKAVGASCTS